MPEPGSSPVRTGRRASAYRCSACRRQFTPLTKTPLAGLRYREKWEAFLACLEEGLSVRKTAEKVGVDHKTTFRWRHRFLAGPSETKPAVLRGIVESDETFIRRFRKGERRLDRPARKRCEACLDFLNKWSNHVNKDEEIDSVARRWTL